jgi:DNA-binding transcriptional ArsR family regulator
MANQTAGDILRFIGDGQKTATEISEYLSLPMNTAKYHIENLLDAGLISIAATKYSIKGREVKVYGLTSQLLIVALPQTNVRSLLLKYASLFTIVALGTVVISLIMPLLGGAGAIGGTMDSAAELAAPSKENAAGYARAAMESAAPAPVTLPDAAVAFFIGGALVILILLSYEMYLWRRSK